MTPDWKLTAAHWSKLPWTPHWRRRPSPSPECQRAMDLIASIDAGGIPLNPAKVNDVARRLGLEVSKRAPVEETIARIRVAVCVERSFQEQDFKPRTWPTVGSTITLMKTSYLFIAILASSILGAFVSGRSAKNALFLVIGLVAAYGLFRMLG